MMIFSVLALTQQLHCSNCLLRVATRSLFCVSTKDGDSWVLREMKGEGLCCGARGLGGCKCRAANRLHVLSLTPEKRASRNVGYLQTKWSFSLLRFVVCCFLTVVVLMEVFSMSFCFWGERLGHTLPELLLCLYCEDGCQLKKHRNTDHDLKKKKKPKMQGEG